MDCDDGLRSEGWGKGEAAFGIGIDHNGVAPIDELCLSQSHSLLRGAEGNLRSSGRTAIRQQHRAAHGIVRVSFLQLDVIRQIGACFAEKFRNRRFIAVGFKTDEEGFPVFSQGELVLAVGALRQFQSGPNFGLLNRG